MFFYFKLTRRIQRFLEKRFDLYDTCGVLNLHGIPGIIGGVASIITIGFLSDSSLRSSIDHVLALEIVDRTTGQQSLYQFIYLCCTLAISLASGTLVGYLLRLLDDDEAYFLDERYWEVPELQKEE